MSMSLLSFTLSPAHSLQDLRDAAQLRAQAYGHHLPTMAQALAEPDALDQQAGTTVLLCRDKASGLAVGTVRLQRNHPQPLQIEHSLALPEVLGRATRAEVSRLAVRPGSDALLRPMLIKACWLHAVSSQIRWLVIGARSAALIRIYRGLGFADLLPPGEQVPLAHAGGLPHNVLAFDVVGAERAWHAAAHPMYGLMVDTWHPDLELTPAVRLAVPGRHRAALEPVALA